MKNIHSPFETVFEAVNRAAKETPDKIALVSDKETITYNRLATMANAVAEGLRLNGVCAGQLIGVGSGRAADNLVGLIGSMAFGAVPVCLPNEAFACAGVINDANPKLVLASRGDPSEDGTRVIQNVEKIYVNDLLSSSRKLKTNYLERQVRGDEIAMIYYTSGTTSGIRKGVMQSYKNLHVTAKYISEIMCLDESVCEFVASPVDNAFWFGRCRCILRMGGTLLLSSGTLNPFAILTSLSRNNGNSISGDTPIFMLFLHQMQKHLHRIAPKLRWIKIASQAMPDQDKRHLMDILPKTRIVMNYGLTEAMRTAILPFFEFPEKLDSVGRPCPTVSVKIVGKNGQELPPGEIGEILISGDNVASGYLRKPNLWSERYNEGWYQSRDLGFLDKDGFLYIKGRIDQAINVGGKTIAPNEVEKYLRPLLKVENFAVCGIKDPNGILGEVLALSVEGEWQEVLPWYELRVHLLEKMEPTFVPKEAFCVTRFPRTNNNKIQLTLLRKNIEKGRYKRCGGTLQKEQPASESTPVGQI